LFQLVLYKGTKKNVTTKQFFRFLLMKPENG
jgi:hypothetical protein